MDFWDWTSRRVKKIEIEHFPVKISTLPFDEQCDAYRHLHKTATPAQIAEYYKLHCDQLDEMRCRVVHDRLDHWEDRVLKRRALLKSFCRGNPASKREQRAQLSNAERILQNRYRVLAKDRALAREVEQLIEECEALLKQERKEFTTVDWRPFTSRKRWRDGKRGWTGLSEEEVRTDIVEVRGRDVSSRRVPIDVAHAVYRAQFARSFPRAADKRICAGDGEMDT